MTVGNIIQHPNLVESSKVPEVIKELVKIPTMPMPKSMNFL